MEFEKANFQNNISANKRISKTDKIEATWTKETNNKLATKLSEATRKLWHVLQFEWFKNLRRQSQIAEKLEQIAKEKLEIWTKKFLTAPNAQWRCDARNDQAAAWHFNSQNHRIPKMPRVLNHS